MIAHFQLVALRPIGIPNDGIGTHRKNCLSEHRGSLLDQKIFTYQLLALK